MEQGRIIEKYPAANIVERPDAERPLYQVTKATKSPSYGVLKPLLERIFLVNNLFIVNEQLKEPLPVNLIFIDSKKL